jgi:signal transduction histidine kinase/ligand-binding sensor domain-containing protein/DNA-binding NarL/FixJ family response regulator
MKLIRGIFSRRPYRRGTASALVESTPIEDREAGGAEASASRPTAPDPFDVVRLGRPVVRVYNDKDGLPQNSILAMTFDRAGYLWVGTEDGAAYYNGRVWTVVRMPTRTRSNSIGTLLAAADGSLWFGTQGSGLAHLERDQWTTYDTSSGLPSNTIISLLETDHGDAARALWVGTWGGGVARLVDGQWTTFDTTSGLPNDAVASLLESRGSDGSRALWVGTRGGGLARLALSGAGEWTIFDTGSGLPSNVVFTSLETEGADKTRTLWVGTNGGGLARLAFSGAGEWTVFDTSSGLPNNSVVSLLETNGADGAGTLWVGTRDGGLARRERGEWSTLDVSRGLPHNEVFSLLATDGPNGATTVWVGTRGGGLARLEQGQWTTLDTSSGLPSNEVFSLLDVEGADGARALWVGTMGGGLARLERGEWTTFDTTSGLPGNMVLSLLGTRGPDGTSTLWVGTRGDGLARFERGEWTTFDTRSGGDAGGLPDNTVVSLLETQGPDGARTLWAGTLAGGLARFERGIWTTFDTTSGLPNNGAVSLLETESPDGARTLWVGTNGGGLACLALSGAGEWTTFDTGSGLPHGEVWSLLEARGADGARTLWVGTNGGGLAWRDLASSNPGWNVLSDTTTPALPNNTVYQMRQDRQGRIYLFTNKGVARLTPRTPTPDDSSKFAVYTFTTENGLPSDEFNSGASMVDSLGRIWGGTGAGAVMFDPTREVEDGTSKPLYIERTLVNGEVRSLSASEVLAYDENNLEFAFALLSYFREKDTRYRTQLVGFDRALSEWSADHRRNYTNLSAGEYTFRVWGKDHAGNVSGPAWLAFRIQPAPWKTWWAYMLYAGTAAGLGYGGMRYRLQALRRRGEELEATVAERTAELAETASELSQVVERLKVSERRALDAKEEALKAKDEALEASRAKSVFLSNMSHELRTPLNAVLGFAQLMERDKARGAEDRENLATIVRSGEYLLDLINDVLSIAKIEAGKLTLDQQPFDIGRLLAHTEKMIWVRAEAKGLSLAVDLDAGLPRYVYGDEKKLREVLINLLGNAVKFTDSGSVTLRAGWRNGVARFEVVDTGQGISAEEIGQLFESFVQTESGRKAREGTGLGLAISRNYVRLMGGDIAVESAVGKGTTFRFDVRLPETAEGEARAERRTVVGLEPGQQTYRILVADDTRENRTLLVKLLSPVGFDVREATDGSEAVEIWDAWRPHLIFMDVRMPGTDGIDATRAIREREDGGAACKIVALTASAFEHDRERIFAAGCDDSVTKPFREHVIFEKLEEHLEARFVFEEGEAPVAAETGQLDDIPSRLATLPSEWVEALKAALIRGRDIEANRAVDRIAERDEVLAAELRRMIRQVQFDEMLELIERIPE